MKFPNGNFGPLEALEDPNVVYHFENREVGSKANMQGIIKTRQLITEVLTEWEYVTGEGNPFHGISKSRGFAWDWPTDVYCISNRLTLFGSV